MTSKYFTCPSCHANTPVKTSATDRVDLERDRGETFMATCTHCLKPRSVHVNEVRAIPHRVVTGLGGVAGAAAVVALWNLGFIAWIAGALPLIVYRAQLASASTFNGYRLPRPEK